MTTVVEPILSSHESNEVHFSIQFVSKVTGINAHTIRAWEKRYNAVKPGRDQNGRRVYTQEEIDRLNLLGHLVNEGHTISEVAGRATPELEEILGRFPSLDNREQEEFGLEDFDIEVCLQNINMGLSFFKLDIISHELEKATRALSPKDYATKLMYPLLEKVRSLKQQNMLGDSQKEALMSIFKLHIGKKLYSFHQNHQDEDFILLTAPEGSLNEIGIMLTALLCQNYRLNFYYLSTNVEASTIANLATQFKAKTVIIGGSYSSMNSETQSRVEKYAMELREALPKTELWFCGLTKPSLQLFQNRVHFIENLTELDSKLAQLR